MSLLINGMGMPDSCRHCRFCIPTESDCDDSPYECVLNDYLHWATWLDVPSFVSEGCQLIKLPTPHGDLIDREVLLNEYKADPKEEKAMMNENLAAYLMMDEIVEKVVENIKSIPTIIEAEE